MLFDFQISSYLRVFYLTFSPLVVKINAIVIFLNHIGLDVLIIGFNNWNSGIKMSLDFVIPVIFFIVVFFMASRGEENSATNSNDLIDSDDSWGDTSSDSIGDSGSDDWRNIPKARESSDFFKIHHENQIIDLKGF